MGGPPSLINSKAPYTKSPPTAKGTHVKKEILTIMVLSHSSSCMKTGI